MAACCQGFDDGGAKIFELAESSDDCDANDLHESDSCEEERATNGSGNAIVLNVVDARIMQIGRRNVLNFSPVDNLLMSENPSGGDEGPPVLREHWKPEGRLNVGRSRSGFPDCHEDHLVQLLVCKNQNTREALDIADKYEMKVEVSYNKAGESSLKMPDYQCKRFKSESKSETNAGSMIGVVGYLFRFHEPDTKYKISFSLNAIQQRKRRKRKSAKKQTSCETISEISVTLETGTRASSKSCKTRKNGKARIVSPLFKLSPASLSEKSMVLYKRSSRVMNELQSRRDNAKWEDFDKYASDLLFEFTDADTQIAIKLEQSVGACYQNELERSLQLIDESFSLIPLAENSQLLAARGYGYRAGVMRRQRNLGEASDLVQLAEQNSHACHTNLDSSFIVYERASVLLDFIGRMSQRSPKLVDEALRNLEKCIDVCLRVEREDGGLDLYVKKHHFALIKIAMLLLDCRTEAARERVVSEEFIAKGQECLNRLKTKYWSEIAEGVKIQFNLASSDLAYRKGNCAEAEKFATRAKEMAEALGFNTEISHAQERLDHLRALTRCDTLHANGLRRLVRLPAIESEGENGDVSSSGNESDWLRILE
ncbi:uncharacterized protein LOC144666814 [Oculina patagonica]